MAFLKEQLVRRVLAVKGAENSAAGPKAPEERVSMRFHGELPGWNGMQTQTAWANGERGRGAMLAARIRRWVKRGRPTLSQDRLLRTLGSCQADEDRQRRGPPRQILLQQSANTRHSDDLKPWVDRDGCSQCRELLFHGVVETEYCLACRVPQTGTVRTTPPRR